MNDSQSTTMERSAVDGERSIRNWNDVLLTGVPYIHPALTIRYDDVDSSLTDWDRVVLLSGGMVLGFSLGICVTICLVATHGDSLDIGLLVCAAVVLISSMANGFSCFVLRNWFVNRQKRIRPR